MKQYFPTKSLIDIAINFDVLCYDDEKARVVQTSYRFQEGLAPGLGMTYLFPNYRHWECWCLG